MLLRIFARRIAPATMIAVVTAGAQEVSSSSLDLVVQRARVYARGTWTVAYVPEAHRGDQVPYGRKYHVLTADKRYRLEADPRKSNHCFLVSHRSSDYGGQESYLGVAALSILKKRTDPVQPVSMFRNKGWLRSDDGQFSDESAIRQSDLGLGEFFRAHSGPKSLTQLDTSLGYKWHGQYGKNEEHNSWRDHVLWNLSNNLNEGVSGWAMRFDGKLIRFKFTDARDSREPPCFCLRSESRLETVVALFSPHLAGTLKFTIVFPSATEDTN